MGVLWIYMKLTLWGGGEVGSTDQVLVEGWSLNQWEERESALWKSYGHTREAYQVESLDLVWVGD